MEVDMFGPLDTGDGAHKWAGVTISVIAGEGVVGLWKHVGIEGRVDQGVPEGMVPAEGEQGKGGEYESRGGTLLEVAEMVADDLWVVDAGGLVGKDKGNLIAVAGGKWGAVKAEVQERDRTQLRVLSTTVLRSPQLRKKVDFGGSLVEVSIIGSLNAGKWDLINLGYLDGMDELDQRISFRAVQLNDSIKRLPREYSRNSYKTGH
eukprot:g36387.t1